MSFAVPADAYDRFMGRYSSLLSAGLCDVAGVAAGRRALDVGCGPGALLRELVVRVGASSVAAVEPSEPFVAAVQERFPGVDVRLASAEELPFADAAFDVALAQLVVHFMSDPARGVAEMRRVTRDGGAVVACVWDHGTGHGPLSPYWAAVRELDPGATDESGLMGSWPGQLHALFVEAGLREVEETSLTVRVEHPSFDEWWEPFTFGVGTAGAHLATLDEDGRAAVRERCREALGEGPFTVEARAWTSRGVV